MTRLYFNAQIHLSRQNFRHNLSLFQLPGFRLSKSTQIAVEATQVKIMSHFYSTR